MSLGTIFIRAMCVDTVVGGALRFYRWHSIGLKNQRFIGRTPYWLMYI
jgi:hypothetical protein